MERRCSDRCNFSRIDIIQEESVEYGIRKVRIVLAGTSGVRHEIDFEKCRFDDVIVFRGVLKHDVDTVHRTGLDIWGDSTWRFFSGKKKEMVWREGITVI
ncbi:hypothetical protein GCK72_004729 [Caenorhabditis remanei]|uniref:Uncharacterized protein n=1 Tax=Caenorhabditis remanei TaxID=31234 RepID=A0A6A5HCP0_CAERE|nr:hypothetical protein GCK72_004729 [Caenorhabditis remanei]KAF1764779.1 hypothetical protein GCK72_004729 [Caenorhabditis remanei]